MGLFDYASDCLIILCVVFLDVWAGVNGRFNMGLGDVYMYGRTWVRCVCVCVDDTPDVVFWWWWSSDNNIVRLVLRDYWGAKNVEEVFL